MMDIEHVKKQIELGDGGDFISREEMLGLVAEIERLRKERHDFDFIKARWEENAKRANEAEIKVAVLETKLKRGDEDVVRILERQSDIAKQVEVMRKSLDDVLLASMRISQKEHEIARPEAWRFNGAPTGPCPCSICAAIRARDAGEVK